MGQPAGGAGAGREWPDFYAEGAVVPGPAHSHPLVRPAAHRGGVFFCSLSEALESHSSSRAVEVKLLPIVSAETWDVSEGGDPAGSEVAGGDAGAGEADEDVQELPDGAGDLQPAQELSPGPRLQTHPSARLLCAQRGGKDEDGLTNVQGRAHGLLFFWLDEWALCSLQWSYWAIHHNHQPPDPYVVIFPNDTLKVGWNAEIRSLRLFAFAHRSLISCWRPQRALWPKILAQPSFSTAPTAKAGRRPPWLCQFWPSGTST